MINKKVIDNELKKSLDMIDDKEKVRATANMGVGFWTKLYNSLCVDCKRRSLIVTRRSMNKGKPNKFKFDMLCEDCQKNVINNN